MNRFEQLKLKHAQLVPYTANPNSWPL